MDGLTQTAAQMGITRICVCITTIIFSKLTAHTMQAFYRRRVLDRYIPFFAARYYSCLASAALRLYTDSVKTGRSTAMLAPVANSTISATERWNPGR